MQSVESGSDRAQQSSARHGLNWTMKGGGITFGIMVLVLIVALLFAANQNDVIGWLLVIISGGWLILAVLVVLGVRRGARSVSRQVKNMSASMAPRAGEVSETRVSDPSSGQAGSMQAMKLDHSFKIVQVQARVIQEELAKGAGHGSGTGADTTAGSPADMDMVSRALETIEITSSNAREMIKESRTASGAGHGTDQPDGGPKGGQGAHGAGGSSARGRSGSRSGDDGPITGEVIN